MKNKVWLFTAALLLFTAGCGKTDLTEKEINESYNYEDFESFLETLEDKYGFRLKDCNWMTTESLSIYRYKDGKEVANV